LIVNKLFCLLLYDKGEKNTGEKRKGEKKEDEKQKGENKEQGKQIKAKTRNDDNKKGGREKNEKKDGNWKTMVEKLKSYLMCYYIIFESVNNCANSIEFVQENFNE